MFQAARGSENIEVSILEGSRYTARLTCSLALFFVLRVSARSIFKLSALVRFAPDGVHVGRLIGLVLSMAAHLCEPLGSADNEFKHVVCKVLVDTIDIRTCRLPPSSVVKACLSVRYLTRGIVQRLRQGDGFSLGRTNHLDCDCAGSKKGQCPLDLVICAMRNHVVR